MPSSLRAAPQTLYRDPATALIISGTDGTAPLKYRHGQLFSDGLAIDDSLAAKQPLDSDLTAIAGISTTSYGRNLLTVADGTAAIAAFGKTTIAGYGITDFNSLGDARWPQLAGSYANPSWITSLPWAKITTAPTTIAGYGITDFNSLGDARWQPLDSDLTTWATITPAAGIGTFLATPTLLNLKAAVTDETTVGWNLLTLANPSAIAFLQLNADNTVTAQSASAQRTALSLVPGTDVVAFNGALGTPASGNLANCTFPTLNQNTTGSAAKWTTARNLAGNSVDGSANVAFANKFVVQGTADTGLSAAQFLGALGTGIVKNTTTTGVLSIAVAGDFPTLNQSTTGSAATLTTPRAIYGNNFDGSAALTQVIATTYGGTGNGFTKFSGPTTSEKTKTVRDASDTILELGGSYTPTGTWTSLTMVTPVLGTPASGNLANCTFPTLNQSTTGSAASLSISGQTALLTVTGLLSTNRIKTVRDAADTILELGGSYTPTGTWTNLTLVTPALGTPSSGNASNLTNIPVANATGTLPVANGGWGDTGTALTSYSPTITSGSGTITTLGTVTGAYKQVGKIVFVRIVITITTNGTAGTSVKATLPVNAKASTYQVLPTREMVVVGFASVGAILNSDATKVVLGKYDGTYPGGDGYVLVVEGWYESA